VLAYITILRYAGAVVSQNEKRKQVLKEN